MQNKKLPAQLCRAIRESDKVRNLKVRYRGRQLTKYETIIEKSSKRAILNNIYLYLFQLISKKSNLDISNCAKKLLI